MTTRQRNARTFWDWCRERGFTPVELTGKAYELRHANYQHFSKQVRSAESIINWKRQDSISNRLFGSVINSEGEAI